MTGKMKRRIGILTTLALIMVGGTGCMSKKEVNEQAIKKFEEKYGVDYEILYTETIGDSIENRDEIRVYVDSLMDEGESATIYSWEENGKVKSSDNLFGYIIREDYENAIKEIAQTEFPDVKVYTYFVSSFFDNSLGKNATLEDAYTVGEKMISYIWIVIRTDQTEEEFGNSADRICELLNANKLYGAITYCAVTDIDEFEEITRMNFQDKIDVFAKDAEVSMPYQAYKNKSF